VHRTPYIIHHTSYIIHHTPYTITSVFSDSFTPYPTPESLQPKVSGGMDRSVIVWSVGSECQLFVLRTHTNIVVSVAVSPDGTLVAR